MVTAAQQQTARPDQLEPVPVTGCGVCLDLFTAREISREAGDLGSVAVQNAELRNHPHGRGSA
ncbi:hypothetical protein ACFWWM_35455 [Streptomyces sp. NPDC058682]|uniref:hypothetical protein n=1 Tax=unclassified Streptomyces TaxID=2593676 RepID=UPI0035DC197C